MSYLDMVAKLGVGGAHPGGFEATLEQLQRFPIPPGSRVLDVGLRDRENRLLFGGARV
ncbi:hypothetical protein LJK88_05535 [Paenibacillus sp. P26]|nr:hypothetical protein LJK88_05535 [Paenibacillus sp. P26]